MPQFLYRIQPVRPEALVEGFTDDEKGSISEHFEHLKRLTANGTVLLAGRTTNTDSNSFGIVILLAGSTEPIER